MEEEIDIEFQRGLLTRKMEAGEDVIIQTDKAAVLNNVMYPKAEYHFIVLSKEDIVNVTTLTHDHLSLLDHMMELANQIIEQKNLPSSRFLIGFKINAFMNRLNMHVISDDFHSDTMRRVQHWNTFHTDLFITWQAVYALLSVHSSVKPISADVAEHLLMTRPVQCNQCTYKTGNFLKFKEHLYYHWNRRRSGHLNNTGVANLSQAMNTMNLDGNKNISGNAYPTSKPSNWPQRFGPRNQNPSVRASQGLIGIPVGPRPRQIRLDGPSSSTTAGNNFNYTQRGQNPFRSAMMRPPTAPHNRQPVPNPFKQTPNYLQQSNANNVQKADDEPTGSITSNGSPNMEKKLSGDQTRDQPVDEKPITEKKVSVPLQPEPEYLQQINANTVQQQGNAIPFVKKKWIKKQKNKPHTEKLQTFNNNTKEARDSEIE